MRYILTILSVLSTCTNLYASENNQSLENKIETIINAKILNQIENINSVITINLAILAIFLAVIGLLGFMNFYQKKQLMAEIDEKIEQYVDERFYAKSKEIHQDISQKLASFVRSSTTNLKKEYQKEEFLRNLMFYDLSKILSSELNNAHNISEVFSIYSERYYLVTQLTSDSTEERIKALKKLATGTYKYLTKLQSYKNYITFLKNSDTDIDVLNQIEQLDLAI